MRFALLFSLIFGFVQSKAQSQSDSLKAALREAPASSQVDIYISLARDQYAKSPDSILWYIDQIDQLELSSITLEQRIEIENVRAYGHTMRREFELAEQAVIKAISINSPVDSVLVSDSYNTYGVVFHYQNKNDQAIEWYIKSLNIKELINDKDGALRAYMNIGTLMAASKNYQKAIEYYKKYLSETEHVSNPSHIVQAYFNICSAYNNQHGLNNIQAELDSAIKYGRIGLKLAQENNFSFGIAMVAGTLASPLLRAGYYEEGLEVSTTAHKYAVIHQNQYLIEQGLVNQGFAYTYLGNHLQARKIAERILNEYDRKSTVIDAKRVIYLAEKGLGNYEKSLSYLEAYHHYMDSLQYVKLDEQIASVEAKYETNKKEQEIQNLQQEANIRELEIGQQRLIYGIAIGALIIIAIVISLVFRINKSKSEQAAANLEQRLLRTQMNPHFIFNALGAIQNYMLKNDAQTAGIYLSKFSKLMRQILENSREEYISMSEEIEMLTNYLEVQQSRFQNSFAFDIHVSDEVDIENTSIPPMFAQPFLENAIEHGVADLSEQGTINVTFSKNNNLINIEVTDNGKGLESGSAQAKQHNSLATVITKERMAIFGKNIQQKLDLAIQNIKDTEGHIKGTQVKLNIPFIEN